MNNLGGDHLGRFVIKQLGCDERAKLGIEVALRAHGVQQPSWLQDCSVEDFRREFGMTFYEANIMVKTLRGCKLAGGVGGPPPILPLAEGAGAAGGVVEEIKEVEKQDFWDKRQILNRIRIVYLGLCILFCQIYIYKHIHRTN